MAEAIEIQKRFTYTLNAGNLGSVDYETIDDVPERFRDGVKAWLPKTFAGAAAYLEGRSRLPPYYIDWQGSVEFHLNVPFVKPTADR
jgi:hypothetical protein